MFWRRRHQRDALRFTARMTGMERLETRCMAVMTLALRGDPIHVMAATAASADAHADFIGRVAAELGVRVERLPPDVGIADDGIHEAPVLVATIEEFMLAFEWGLTPPNATALIEGDPPREARRMLKCYREVKLS